MSDAQSTLRAIAARFGGLIEGDQQEVRISFEGHRLLARQSTGKHASFSISLVDEGEQWPRAWSPPHVDLERAPLRCPWQPTITLSKEGRLHRLGRFLRVNREVQVGDARFDPEVYIDSAAPDEVVARLLEGPRSREAALLLLKTFPQVSLYTNESPLSVNIAGLMPEAAVTNGNLQRWLEALVVLAQGLPAVEVQRPRQTPTRPTNVAIALCTISTALFFLATAFFGDCWEVFDSDLYGAGVLTGLALWGLSVPALWWALRGHSNSMVALLTCVGSLLLGLPFGAVMAMITYNGLLDGPCEERAALVVGTELSQSNKSTSYYVTLDLQDGETPPGRFSVSSFEYNRRSRGERVRARVCPGRLGYRWLDEIL